MNVNDIVEVARKKADDERLHQANIDPFSLEEIKETGGIFKKIILPKLQELKTRLEQGHFLVRIYSVPYLDVMPDKLRRIDFVVARVPEGTTIDERVEEWLEHSGSRMVFMANPERGFISVSMTVFGKRYNGQRYSNADIDPQRIESMIFKLVNVIS
ncbi:MAG: hypothetical protein HQL84_00235 [Magnetococcales bacterium]|nr:hypothetical protein [Magnetococcales bacterium]MBF0148456.1 hypothetical protein [Magnetococcales bacterium]MBF0172603.1 hypothetical protein [Magnetococcales bacterium]MBF0346288.1 hypothetical protein [Magnetococcales bacterium]MBF0629947.1 hypothetical protein [Magnetococcales bacterium]